MFEVSLGGFLEIFGLGFIFLWEILVFLVQCAILYEYDYYCGGSQFYSHIYRYVKYIYILGIYFCMKCFKLMIWCIWCMLSTHNGHAKLLWLQVKQTNCTDYLGCILHVGYYFWSICDAGVRSNAVSYRKLYALPLYAKF